MFYTNDVLFCPNTKRSVKNTDNKYFTHQLDKPLIYVNYLQKCVNCSKYIVVCATSFISTDKCVKLKLNIQL